MSDLTFTFSGTEDGALRRWLLRGPHGAVQFEAISAGGVRSASVYLHEVVAPKGAELEDCPLCRKCWRNALGGNDARRLRDEWEAAGEDDEVIGRRLERWYNEELSTPVPVSEGSQVSGEGVGPVSGVGRSDLQIAATGAGNGGVVPVPVAAPKGFGRRNPHCSNCGDERGGSFGHEISECRYRAGMTAEEVAEILLPERRQEFWDLCIDRYFAALECTHQAGCPVHGDVRDCEPIECPHLADVLAGRAKGCHDDSTCGWCATHRRRGTAQVPVPVAAQPEPATFRKKPVEVRAFRWTGDNQGEMFDFVGVGFGLVDPEDRGEDPDITGEVYDVLHSTWVGVKTGQWVIRGIKGEFYPCDPEVFAETYERVPEPAWGSGPLVDHNPETPAREVWSGVVAPGGYVCGALDPNRPDGICGMPVESEPCPEHITETPGTGSADPDGGQ